MKKITFISITLLFSAAGCSTEKLKDEKPQNEVVQAADNNIRPVQLDNGNKWIANTETTAGIQIMTQLIETAQANPDYSIDSLKQSLILEFTNILNRCTMKGESHEQLHNYLLPLRAMLESLAEGEKQDLDEIKSYLNTYKNYLE